MTPLRFRAWFKGDEEQQANPCMIQNVHLVYDGYNGGLTEQDDPNHILGGCSSFGTLLNNKDFIVMQSTGLHDKNGKEIFEGDILRTGNSDIPIGCVKWSEVEAWFWVRAAGLRAETFPLPECEVIGNIYENPDLLLSSQ